MAVIDELNIDGTDYDVRDKAAVRIDQGAANAGKALVVGSDGSVTIGDAGISEAVKASLLALLLHVVYSDEHGMTYYNALYEALYGTQVYPRIAAEYDAENHIVKAGAVLDTLRPYLTVTRYASAADSGTVITEYTMSGSLVAGNNSIDIAYEGLSTSVQVAAHEQWVDAYTDDETITTRANADITPFVLYGSYDYNYGKAITALEADIVKTGIIPVSYIDGSKVREGATVNLEDFVLVENLTFSQTGRCVAVLSAPLMLPSGALLAFGYPNISDYARWHFGGDVTDTGFTTNQNGKYSIGTMGLGFNVYRQ